MTSHIHALAILGLTTVSLPWGVAAQQSAGSSDIEQEAMAVVHSFKAALQTGDSLAVLDLLHPEVRVYEGGRAETGDQYRSGHLRSDIAFLGAVTTETTWDEIVPGADVTFYLSEYTVKGEYRGREIDAHGTETIALVPTETGWRIRHIHWSSR